MYASLIVRTGAPLWAGRASSRVINAVPMAAFRRSTRLYSQQQQSSYKTGYYYEATNKRRAKIAALFAMLAAAYYATPKHLRPDFSKKVKQEQTPKEEPVQEEQPAEEPVQEEQPVDVSSEEPSSSEESTTETAEQLAETEEEVNKEGAYNPETGEINWDCPCLGGMAHGTCGEEFKEAFACFVYSDADPKGIDCVEKFQHMQDCFRAHPEEYAEQLKDEEEATAAAEAVGAAETPGEGDGSREDSTESFEVVAAPDKSPETDAEPVFQETDDILSSSDESTPDAELQTPTEELDPMEEVELTESS